MEEKTTKNENNSFLETPLINGRRESMELEQVTVETIADEPIWLKIICFFGGVYPILRENGKCKCNWKTVCLCILPFVYTLYILLILLFSLKNPTVSSVCYNFAVSVYLLIPVSLSFTRKRFSDSIVGEENRLYINTLVKRVLMKTCIINVIVTIALLVFFLSSWRILQGKSLGSRVGYSIIFVVLISVVFTILSCPLVVLVLRCLFLAHTSVTQVKTKLLEMARGTEVEELQTKLLEIGERMHKASVSYLQVPLSLFFFSGMNGLMLYGILTYIDASSPYWIVCVLFGIGMVIPLWLLTRIEKFYLWTLRELLHRNTVMPLTEHTNLLAKYDTIAPQASLFGIYITRGRVASIIIAVLSSIVPKIAIYLYNNIENTVIQQTSGNHTKSIWHN